MLRLPLRSSLSEKNRASLAHEGCGHVLTGHVAGGEDELADGVNFQGVFFELALKKMRNFRARIKPPFVASITRTGEVYLRWPKS